ncbi:alpha/beta hydrolase family protein [Dyadobacter pollutisoli]|uniref:Acetylxylan esterase n=1 Tax=Dyadobacter pollutisoli TaxID=2910158 RepID=A0A9E8SLZ6_9BACT|nr:acetylxylan esterase [Dyadobacter pollutisoli]WAC12749.1 acetylxylan esterase [Dyadobacter pollutisoli]
MKKLTIILLLFVSFSYGQNSKTRFIKTEKITGDSLLWDLKALSVAPEVKWLTETGPVRSLLYKSVDYEGKKTEVFAYYSNPDIIAGKPAGTQKFPGVVLIHGGGGKAFKEWVEKWASEGYAAIAMDLSGNGADGQKIANPGPDQSNENKFEKIEKGSLKDVWTYHAVASSILAHSLLLSMPEVDTSKTSVTGISWGGYLTCIVASLDDRFLGAVPVYGCAYYDESDVFKVPLNQLSADNKKRWMQYFDPSVYLRYAKPSFFFINGNKDKHYNVEPYIKTYSLVKSSKIVCVIPDMKHSHQWGWQPPEIRYFFETLINPGKSFPNITYVSVEKDEFSLVYKMPYTASLTTAAFYYTNDVESTNEQRVWTMQEGKSDPDNNKVTFPIPKSGFKYGFFYIKDSNNISASTTYMVDFKPTN